MIFIGADHRGFELKAKINKWLFGRGYEFEDVGAFEYDHEDDYADYAILVAQRIAERNKRGVVICGSGVGVDIAANKVKGIRAALCNDTYSAKMSRLHNAANVLILPGRVIDNEVAKIIVKIWFSTPFEGGRHQRRLDKIKAIEAKVKCL